MKSKMENHEVPIYCLFKDTIAELETALTTDRHPLLVETCQRTRHIVEKYV